MTPWSLCTSLPSRFLMPHVTLTYLSTLTPSQSPVHTRTCVPTQAPTHSYPLHCSHSHITIWLLEAPSAQVSSLMLPSELPTHHARLQQGGTPALPVALGSGEGVRVTGTRSITGRTGSWMTTQALGSDLASMSDHTPYTHFVGRVPSILAPGSSSPTARGL